MVVKVKENYDKTRQVKNNDKSKKYILRGRRNVRYHDRILSIKKRTYNFTTQVVYKEAFDIRRKGSHPHLTPANQQIFPQNHKKTNPGCKYFLLYSLNYLNIILIFF